jgi:uncharacterized protein (TIGR00369 family)
MMDSMVERARHVLRAQPVSAWLGVELREFTTCQAEIGFRIRRELTGQHGVVHGGIVSYAADNALAFAGGSVLGPDVVTSEFKINFVRPALGEEIVARATVVHIGRTQAVCRCDVFFIREGIEALCATAQGTIVLRARTRGRSPGLATMPPAAPRELIAPPPP